MVLEYIIYNPESPSVFILMLLYPTLRRMLFLFKSDPTSTTIMKSESDQLEGPQPDSTYETLLVSR